MILIHHLIDRFGRTPLHEAVTNGHHQAVTLLIDKYGADMFSFTAQGQVSL